MVLGFHLLPHTSPACPGLKAIDNVGCQIWCHEETNSLPLCLSTGDHLHLLLISHLYWTPQCWHLCWLASRSSLDFQIRQRRCRGDLVHKHKSTFDVTNCHLTEARGCGTICVAVSRGTMVFRQLFSLDFCWWRNVKKRCAQSHCIFFTQLHTEEKESHDTLLIYLVMACNGM